MGLDYPSGLEIALQRWNAVLGKGIELLHERRAMNLSIIHYF